MHSVFSLTIFYVFWFQAVAAMLGAKATTVLVISVEVGLETVGTEA